MNAKTKVTLCLFFILLLICCFFILDDRNHKRTVQKVIDKETNEVQVFQETSENENIQSNDKKCNDSIKDDLDLKIIYSDIDFSSFSNRNEEKKNNFIGKYIINPRQRHDHIYLVATVNNISCPKYIFFSYTKRKSCCFPDSVNVFLNNIKHIKKLGSGRFGVVFRMSQKRGCSHNYAIKRIDKVSLSNPRRFGYVHNELYFLKYFQLNPNKYILKGYAGYFSDNRVLLIYELLQFTLEEAFKYNQLTYKQIKQYIGDLFLAIVSLHKNKIVHGDIKLDNIGIDLKGRLKIFDFSCAVKLDSRYSMDIPIAPIFYRPPENLIDPNKPLSYDVDWWAFGIVLYTICENDYPYYTSKKRNLSAEMRKQNIIENIKNGNMRKFKNKHISDNLKNLITLLIHPDRAQRLGTKKNHAIKIAEHPYFTAVDMEEEILN